MKFLSQLRWVLAPLGWLYGSLMLLRRRLYAQGWLKSRALPGITISVGNLEAGGTGKSPVVMSLAQKLLHTGARPVILTRGYRSGLGPQDSAALLGSKIILAPESKVPFHADEATMQAERLQEVPVVIGGNRWAAAQRYLKNFPPPTHWILDDGFQHLKLQRHQDIVLLDAQRPFAEGRCLPAGRLREWPSTLQKASLVLLTRATDDRIPPTLLTLRQNYSIPVHPVFFINGQPLQIAGPEQDWTQDLKFLLALGIAHPDRVIDHCHQQNLPIRRQLLVADHELFPLEKLRKQASEIDAILTTEKDYWRQADVFQSLQKPVFILPLELEFSAGDPLSKILAEFTDS